MLIMRAASSASEDNSPNAAVSSFFSFLLSSSIVKPHKRWSDDPYHQHPFEMNKFPLAPASGEMKESGRKVQI